MSCIDTVGKSKSEILMLGSIFSSRFAQGLYYAVPYTTLLDLAAKYNVPTEDISEIYSLRSAGIIIGAVLFSVYMQFLPMKNRVDPLSWIGGFSIMSSIPMCVIPLVSIRWLKILVLIGGIGYGVQELGYKSLILDTFGPLKSKGLLQMNALMYTIGNIASILVTKPFLGTGTSDTVCQRVHDTKIRFNSSALSSDSHRQHVENLVHWPWIIAGIGTFVAGVLVLLAGLSFIRLKLRAQYVDAVAEKLIKNPEKTKQSGNCESVVEHAQMFFTYDLWILVAIFSMAMCIGGAQHWYQDYVYNFAICVMRMSPSSASSLATVIVVSMAVGRIISVITIRHFNPNTLSVIHLIGFSGSFAILYGYHIGTYMVWIATVIFGFSWSVLNPLIISIGAEFIDLSKLYSLSFVVGMMVGHSLSPLGSQMAIHDANAWIICGLVFSAMYAVPFFLLVWFGPSLRSRYRPDLDALITGSYKEN